MATTRKAPKIEFKEREPGLPGTIGWILDRYRKTGIAIDTVLEAVMGKDEMDGTACPCCGSNKTYETRAIHCNHCAVTTEI